MMWNRNIMLFLCAYVYVHACAEPLLPSQTLRHCGLQPARPLCPWTPQARILQWVAVPPPGIFLTQGSNPHLMSPALAGGFFTTSTT